MLIAPTSSAEGTGEAGMPASLRGMRILGFRNPTWRYRQQLDAGTALPVATAVARDPQVSSKVT